MLTKNILMALTLLLLTACSKEDEERIALLERQVRDCYGRIEDLRDELADLRSEVKNQWPQQRPPLPHMHGSSEIWNFESKVRELVRLELIIR